MTLAVPGTDPVQQFVHDLVLEPVTHCAPDTGGADPALLAKDPKCLGHRIFRAAEGDREITDENARCPVQDEQDLETVGVGEQIEAPGPRGGVDIDQCRCRPLHLCVTIDGVHIWKCKPNDP